MPRSDVAEFSNSMFIYLREQKAVSLALPAYSGLVLMNAQM